MKSPNGLNKLTAINSLPFAFPAQDLSYLSTSPASTDRPVDKKSFSQELAKAGIYLDEIAEVNPLKDAVAIFSGATSPFQRARARSSSPTRTNLAIVTKQQLAFATNQPVLPAAFAFPAFQGYQEVTDLDEDADLLRMKEQYCRMLESSSTL